MEDLLREILREVRNLSYLFFAFAVIWALLFLYLFTLSRRERNLQREVDELRRELDAEGDEQDEGDE